MAKKTVAVHEQEKYRLLTKEQVALKLQYLRGLSTANGKREKCQRQSNWARQFDGGLTLSTTGLKTIVSWPVKRHKPRG